jgi:hypothetical protein
MFPEDASRETKTMRRILLSAAAVAMLVVPANGSGQQQAPSASAGNSPDQAPAQSSTQSTGPSAATPYAQTPPPQQDSLAAAARRAKEQKKEGSKPAKVFTNDNIPGAAGKSSVGAASAAEPTPSGEAPEPSKRAGNDEKVWRDKFAALRHKLEQDQQELNVMERELGVLNVQYYNDPVKALQQQLTRSDINEKTAKIGGKKKEIEADQQAIADAEDDLRKSGGEPGWAR